MLISESATI
uniref:Uncharacterized protein n=1 Tax=Rhizophora mucronata TaxID=61149 RepID=A0A2P2KPX5_RHIMU